MNGGAALRFCGELRLSDKTLRCAAVDGDLAAVGTFAREIVLLRLGGELPEVERRFDFLDSEPYSLALAGGRVFAGLRSGQTLVIALDGEPVALLSSHSAVVCSLACWGGLLASGAWDGCCAVTELATRRPLFAQKVGEFAVTVQFTAEGALVLGLQSGELRLLAAGSFAPLRAVAAHTDIVRDVQRFGQLLASASNDGGVRVWTAALEPAGGVQALHAAFVYALCAVQLPGGEWVLASGGEGRLLKLSDERRELAALPFPCTLWRLAWDARRRRLLSFGEDGLCRCFALEPPAPDDEAHARYAEAAALQTAAAPGLTAAELKKFAAVERMAELPGRREGEVRVFVNAGRPEAYSWAGGRWELVGEVLSGPPRTAYAGDAHFPAGDYEFVFEIQDEGGAGKKLPFNSGDNALIAAEKFLAREQMSVSFKEQISQFLLKNARAPSAAPPAPPAPPAPTGPSFPSGKNPPPMEVFPVLDPVYYAGCNAAMMARRLEELSAGLPAPLSFAELQYLKALIGKLASDERSSLSESEAAVLERKLLGWPAAAALPVLDLIRVFALHPDSQRQLNSADAGLKYTVFAVAATAAGDPRLYALLFKIVANFFKHSPLAAARAEPILAELVELKAAELPVAAVRALFSVLNNFTCYAVEARRVPELGGLLRAMARLPLQFLVEQPAEAVNLLIPLGNLLSLRVPELHAAVEQGFCWLFYALMDQLPPESAPYLSDILAQMN